MAKKQKWIISYLVMLLLVVLGIILLVVMKIGDKNNQENPTVMSAYTDLELFATVPAMQGKALQYTEARDVGDNNYMIEATGTSKDEYDSYLRLLESNGYSKYYDNGKDGIAGNVYSVYYRKEKITLYVCYFTKSATTMINVCDNAIFSEHLFYNDSYIEGNIPGAKTTMHSPELYSVGNSFLFQLKNGRFILNDGGGQNELKYLLDYMEALTPNGEKPIIEAWFISHSHADHMGILQKLMELPDMAERFYVENIYFNAPTKESYKTFQAFDQPELYVLFCKGAGSYVKTTTGSNPNVYRPRIGERYYFNDISIDVIYSPELLDPKEWKTWNASCYVLMYNIEGQKVLLTADAEYKIQKKYIELYDSSYFDIDIFQMPHHGKNVYMEFATYADRIQTLIYPTYVIGSVGNSGANISPQNLFYEKMAEESLTYGTGTKVLSFPYRVGECVTLPRQEWKYNQTPSWIESN